MFYSDYDRILSKEDIRKLEQMQDKQELEQMRKHFSKIEPKATDKWSE